jgi:phage shock protein E
MSRLLALVVTVLLGGLLAGCLAGDEPDAGSEPRAAGVSSEVVEVAEVERLLDDGARVVDVRTPEEFADGHLEGAVNIDVQADDFADRVGELAREESYVVYCASGNRATGAVETMAGLGFTDVVNGGGYDDLAGLD